MHLALLHHRRRPRIGSHLIARRDRRTTAPASIATQTTQQRTTIPAARRRARILTDTLTDPALMDGPRLAQIAHLHTCTRRPSARYGVGSSPLSSVRRHTSHTMGSCAVVICRGRIEPEKLPGRPTPTCAPRCTGNRRSERAGSPNGAAARAIPRRRPQPESGRANAARPSCAAATPATPSPRAPRRSRAA